MHEFEAEPDVRIKRIYEEADDRDGHRVLVDRIWPRGITRERAALDAWAQDLAPSTALRKWFGHDPRRFAGFRQRYLAELDSRKAELDDLRQRARRQRVTLLYAARDPDCNHAMILRDLLA